MSLYKMFSLFFLWKLIIPLYVCVLSHVQLCDTMDCSPPGSSVHGISQKKILKQFAISSSNSVVLMHLNLQKWKWKCFAQSFLTLCGPMDSSPPGSSVHGILQARILEWIAISFSRGSSQPRDWTLVSCTAGRFFTVWATRSFDEH